MFHNYFKVALRNLKRHLGYSFINVAGLAILISCLGLFGLAAYTAEQRTKEIGIRKVLGASMPGIVVLLSKEYAKWVLVANIIAWPVSYFLMKSWLKDYAYRISLSGLIFAVSAIVTLLIAQLTVSFQAFKLVPFGRVAMTGLSRSGFRRTEALMAEILILHSVVS